MVVFKSLIVFDAETTSLPQLDHNTTKITEMAFLGCEIEHLKNSESLPRVLHKLVLVFNPNKLIQPGASKVSGLSNELLANVPPLREEDIDIVRQFISRIPPPVCIVAHNGNEFDFPILRRAFEKLNKSLQNNVYCADSLKAFSILLPKAERPLWTRRSSFTSSEVTPTKETTEPVNHLHHGKVRRELFPDDEALSQWVSSQDGADPLIISQSPSSAPKSYKLNDIYYFYFGRYFSQSHRAEEDSKALLSCIKCCEGFTDWMNENAVIFNSIQPLF